VRFAPEPDLNAGCCAVLFCPSCVTCQTSRELTIRSMNPGGTCLQSKIVPSKPAALSPAQLVQFMQQRQLNMLGQQSQRNGKSV
jgi:hypothetical protein